MEVLSFRSTRVVLVTFLLLAFKAYSSDFLPQGWTVHSSNGVAYYYNQKTGVTQWEKPIVRTQAYPNPYQQQSRPQQPYQNQPLFKGLPNRQRPHSGVTEQSVENSQYQNLQRQDDREIFLTRVNQSDLSAGHTPVAENPTASHELLDPLHASPGASASVVGQFDDTAIQGQKSLIESEGDPSCGRNIPLIEGVIPVSLSQNKSSKSKSISTMGPSSDKQHFITQLREADKQIDDLNGIIDGLEEEKAVLLDQIKLSEESRANVTAAAAAAILSASQEHALAQSELAEQIKSLESLLADRNEQLEGLRTAKKDLENDLAVVAAAANATASILIELKSNFTMEGVELKASKELLAQQEKELGEAYKEIGQLEEDMRNVAGPSMKRLRQPSFFVRILESAFPVWVGGKNSVKSNRRAKGRAAAASAANETLAAMNRTVESLRENITLMASTLESKESTIEELSEQLAERTEEADNRRDAYAALKEGVDSLNEDNERLLEELDARDNQIFELTATLEETIAAADVIRKELSSAEERICLAQETVSADEAAHVAALSKLEGDLAIARTACLAKGILVMDLTTSLEKALKVEEVLKGQVSNVTSHLNDLLRRQQEAAKMIVEESLKSTRNKPWFWFLWPF